MIKGTSDEERPTNPKPGREIALFLEETIVLFSQEGRLKL